MERVQGYERPVEDIDRDRMSIFQSQLSAVESVVPHEVALDFAEDEPIDALMRRFMTYELQAAPTLYLNPEASESAHAPVRFMPRVARGNRHSAHGVFFGDLIFDDRESLSVAVKPHVAGVEQTESCLRDYYNAVAVRELNLDGLKPVGFLIQNGWAAYSLTELDSSLSTLDSIDWTGYVDEIGANPGMTEVWQRVARQMALIHSLGSIAHGDMAARNIATTSDGNVFFIDWERAYISLKQPRDAEVRYGLSHSDVASLLESMWRPPTDNFKAGIGLFHDKDMDTAWPIFCSLFFNEYITYRRGFAGQGTHTHALETATEEELNELERSLREDMGMYAGHLGVPAMAGAAGGFNRSA